jgi:putative acetyltransferase
VNVTKEWLIRRLQVTDLPGLLEIIENARRELGLTRRLRAPLESSDYSLHKIYRHRRSAYFVALQGNEVVGGAGIYPLMDADWGTCELQRLYLRRQSKHCDAGQALLNTCFRTARTLGFYRCYAATANEMSAALSLYEHNGFRRLATPLGKTARNYDDRWLALSLAPTIDEARHDSC